MSRKESDPPPAPDDPRYRRTCTRCGKSRDWTVPRCECGNPEFSLSGKPEEGDRE